MHLALSITSITPASRAVHLSLHFANPRTRIGSAPSCPTISTCHVRVVAPPSHLAHDCTVQSRLAINLSQYDDGTEEYAEEESEVPLPAPLFATMNSSDYPTSEGASEEDLGPVSNPHDL